VGGGRGCLRNFFGNSKREGAALDLQRLLTDWGRKAIGNSWLVREEVLGRKRKKKECGKRQWLQTNTGARTSCRMEGSLKLGLAARCQCAYDVTKSKIAAELI